MKVRNKITKETYDIPESLFNLNKEYFEIIQKEKNKKSLEEYKKSELIEMILNKYESYSEEELKDLKKDVLIMTYKGELD